MIRAPQMLISFALAVTHAAAPGTGVSVQGYGHATAACGAWSDGCVLYHRLADGHAACTTPGIACEPRDITRDEPSPVPRSP